MRDEIVSVDCALMSLWLNLYGIQRDCLMVCVCVVVVFLSWLPKISRSLSVLKSCAARHYLYALLLRRNFIFYWI